MKKNDLEFINFKRKIEEDNQDKECNFFYLEYDIVNSDSNDIPEVNVNLKSCNLDDIPKVIFNKKVNISWVEGLEHQLLKAYKKAQEEDNLDNRNKISKMATRLGYRWVGDIYPNCYDL